MENLGNICKEQNIPRDLYQALNILINELYIFPEIYSCSIIGSLAKGMYVYGSSDIDLLILTNTNIKMRKVLKKIEDKLVSPVFSDDIYIVTHNKTSISLAFREEKNYMEYIDKILNGEFMNCLIKDWSIGGVIEEVMLYDISSSIRCFDKSKCISKKSQEISSKSILFFEEAKKKLHIQFQNKSTLALDQYEKGNKFLFMFAFFELISVFSRLFCVSKNEFHPSLKHLVSKSNYNEFQKIIQMEKFNCEEFNYEAARETVEILKRKVNI